MLIEQLKQCKQKMNPVDLSRDTCKMLLEQQISLTLTNDIIVYMEYSGFVVKIKT